MDNLLVNKIILFILIIIILIIVVTNYFVENEGFENSEYKELKTKIGCSNKYQEQQLKGLLVYDEEVYPIRSEISKSELDFIYNYIKMSSLNDMFKDTHISPYTYSMKISKLNGTINSSRFAFGTKNNHKEIEKNIKQLAKKIGITDLSKESNDLWYGVGWDLEDNIIKFYTISRDKKTLICYVYKTTRDDKKNIIKTKYLSKKTYDVNKDKTYMFKNGKTVEQYNSVPKIDNVYYNKYPQLKEIISDMDNRGFYLDTYSDYDNFLNLYFE
jgi:hypothetical protein